MGQPRPVTPDIGGDESVLAPKTSDSSLLASQRASDKTKRIETDSSGNLYVNVASGSVTTGGLTDTELRATPVPVTIPTPVPVTDNGGSLTVDGTVAVSNFPASQAVTGPLTDVQLRATPVPISGTVTITDGSGPVTVDGTVAVSNFPAVQPISATSLPLPTGAATETTLGTRLADATFTTRINTLGQKTMADSTPVVLASDQTGITVTSGTQTASAALTNVASSATSVTLVASNASRKGVILYNDSTKDCYVKFGATASTTSFTYFMNNKDTLTLTSNPIYTGVIDGVWSAVNGTMRVTELS